MSNTIHIEKDLEVILAWYDQTSIPRPGDIIEIPEWWQPRPGGGTGLAGKELTVRKVIWSEASDFSDPLVTVLVE